jgi:fructokinase
MKIDVLAIGELLADVISEQYVSSLAAATTFRLYQGGSPANVCANLKWMGDSAVMVSCVGDDGIGNMIVDSIKRIGLTDTHIARSRSYPTTIVMVGRSKGTPDFIAYRMADTQIPPIQHSLIEQSSILHSCAFALSRNPTQQNILDAFDLAISMEKKISIDWNFAPAIWQDDGKIIFNRICKNRPLLKMSLDDVERFLGKQVTIDEARNFLSTLTTTVTCLTCGKDGVWFCDNKDASWKYMPAVDVPEVRDTTGAGDAFWSGFLHAYLQKQSTANCIQEGLVIAARKIQKIGPLYG